MSSSKPSTLKRNISIAVFCLLIFFALIIALSDQLIRWFIPHQLSNFGINAQLESIHVNWLDGQFEMNGLTTQGNKNQRLTIKKIAFEWSWQGIWSNQFSVSDIHLDGVQLDLTSDNNKIVMIGPINPAAFSTSAETPPSENTSIWSATIKNIALTNIDVCQHQVKKTTNQCIKWQNLQLNTSIALDQTNNPKLDGNIVVENLAISDLMTVEQIQLKGLNFADNQLKWGNMELNGLHHPNTMSGVEFSGEKIALLQGQANITQQQFNLDRLTINKGQVKTLDQQVELQQLTLANISANQQLALNIEKLATNNINIRLDDANSPISSLNLASLSFADLIADGQNQTASLKDLNLQGAQANTSNNQPLATLSTLSIEQLNGNGKQQSGQIDGTRLTALKVWQLSSLNQYNQLLDVEKLTLETAKANQSQQSFNQLAIKNIKLLENLTGQDGKMLVNLADLNINQAQHLDNIAIKDIKLTAIDAKLSYLQPNGLNLSQWFANSPAPEQATKEQATPKLVSVQSLAINNSRVVIDENTTGTIKQHKIDDLAVNISDIKLNSSDNKPMTVDIAATINQSGKLTAQGKVNPNSDQLMVDINSKIAHLNLIDFSAYSAQHSGYRVDQGQLDSDIKVNINDNKIDSQFDLLLNKFELSKLQQHEKGQAHKELGVPLATALNLLRDSDNNIALSIPISGDLNDPKFSITDVITIVSLKAIKSAVLYTYSPLGFVTMATGVVDLATAMKFNPIEFQPGDLALNQTQKQRLAQTAQVLTDKPQVSLVLCANATANDILPPAQFNPEQIDTLLKLANQRQQSVKSYLVEQHKIAEHRLLLCNVKLDQQAAMPTVAISL